MELITISAKNLGQIVSKDFCPRCFFIKLKTDFKLPFQSFPGIFSSLDSFQKKCVEAMIVSGETGYLSQNKVIKSHTVPHWSKFDKIYSEYNIKVRGSSDALLELEDKTFLIPDFKTSRITNNTDDFAPIYHVQLNAYKEIAENKGFSPVTELSLIYFEPVTDQEIACQKWTLQGYKMDFMAKAVPVAINRQLVIDCLKKTREIYDLQEAPESAKGCKNCESVNNIISLLSTRHGGILE